MPSKQADAVMDALRGFSIGDTVRHRELPGIVGTIVHGPSPVLYHEAMHDIWQVEWSDKPGCYLRYFHFNIFHVQP